MQHVSIQSESELIENINKYTESHTNGREPDKDFIYSENIKRCLTELKKRRKEN